MLFASESDGTAPRPSRSSGTKCRPRFRRAAAPIRPMGCPKSCDRAGVGARVLAGERREQLLLPVAGHPGDPDDLARVDVERDVLERDAEAVDAQGRVSPRADSASAPTFAGRRSSRGGSAPIIMRERLAVLSCVGSQLATTRPPRSTVHWWQSARISSSLWLM